MGILIGMVAEGSHDFVMLEPLIKAEFFKRGISDVAFKPLQPLVDATGASTTDGGWGQVLSWCKRYEGSKIQTFFKPLFANEQACDAVILHLDGDALEEIVPKTSITIPVPISNNKQRSSLVVDCLLDVIKSPIEFSERLAFAVPVQHTEAWLVSMNNNGQDCSVGDAKSIFRNGYNFKSEKLLNFYKRTTAACVAAGGKPACGSYEHFEEQLLAVKID